MGTFILSFNFNSAKGFTHLCFILFLKTLFRGYKRRLLSLQINEIFYDVAGSVFWASPSSFIWRAAICQAAFVSWPSSVSDAHNNIGLSLSVAEDQGCNAPHLDFDQSKNMDWRGRGRAIHSPLAILRYPFNLLWNMFPTHKECSQKLSSMKVTKSSSSRGPATQSAIPGVRLVRRRRWRHCYTTW